MMFFRKPSGISWLVVFLGNPGPKYAGTRHNAGFLTADAAEKRYGVSINRSRFKALTASCELGGEKVLFMKPQTYMNLSGESIAAYVNYYKVDPESELLVIYDDISLDPGQLHIRKKGSAGGHNGMKNIIQHLGTDKFARIRVGIGDKPAGWDLADYVLAPFSKADRELVDAGIGRAADAAEMIVAGEIDRAMNTFNQKI